MVKKISPFYSNDSVYKADNRLGDTHLQTEKPDIKIYLSTSKGFFVPTLQGLVSTRVKSRVNKVPRDWGNWSVISRVRCNEIAKKQPKRSLYRDIVHYYFVTVLRCTTLCTTLNTAQNYGTEKL